MNIIKWLNVVFLVFLLAFTACQKEEEVPALTESMSAKVDGRNFQASAFLVARAGMTTSINGTLGPASNPESIGLSIHNAQIGTFLFEVGREDFAVYNSDRGEYISTSGTLQITAMTGEWIEGSFSFVAHSINNSAANIVISEGKFKMKFD